MDCRQADFYIMKYLDNTITEQERELLNKHIDVCESCKADFLVYNSVAAELDGMEIVEAPEGFEACVMEKVYEEAALNSPIRRTLENALCFACGLFSAASGLVLLVYLYIDDITAFIRNSGLLGTYANALTKAVGTVSNFAGNISNILNSFTVRASDFLPFVRYACLLIFALLAILQFLNVRRIREMDLCKMTSKNEPIS